jgi:hypothetical protein
MFLSSGKIFKSFCNQKCFSFASDLYFSKSSGASYSIMFNAVSGVSQTGEKDFLKFKLLCKSKEILR